MQKKEKIKNNNDVICERRIFRKKIKSWTMNLIKIKMARLLQV